MSGAVHRTKALEWRTFLKLLLLFSFTHLGSTFSVTHQATVAKRVMLGLHTVTMQKTNLLARRPFFVFWFMAQIARFVGSHCSLVISSYYPKFRCLQLWTLDKTLTIAVQLSKEFLAPIDYLTSLWPSEGKV